MRRPWPWRRSRIVHAFFYETLVGTTILTILETLAILVPVLMGMAYAT